MPRPPAEIRASVIYQPVSAAPDDKTVLRLLIALTVVCIGVVAGGSGAACWWVYSFRDGATYDRYRYDDSRADVVGGAGGGGGVVNVADDVMPTPSTSASTSASPAAVPSGVGPAMLDPRVITKDELRDMVYVLWTADENRIPETSYDLNLQGKTDTTSTSDQAPLPLFTSLGGLDLATVSPTFAAFLALRGAYNPAVRESEIFLPDDLDNIETFLDVVISTNVMQRLHEFLILNGYSSPDKPSFYAQLHDIWFTLYNRSPKTNVSDSCGFEHVFLGERRGQKILGFHNWIQFYMEELSDRVDYQGYVHARNRLLNVQLLWVGRRKKQSSFFVGTSPEFEMAVYTLCFLTRTNRMCQFTIDAETFRIQTYDVQHVDGLQIATAFLVM